jgi:hypothetical protein
LFACFLVGAQAQTYMYIEDGMITTEDPIYPTDEVSLQLLGNFSNGGSYVVDYSVSLDGFTVNFEINADSDGGITSLIPFDLSYDLGMYEPGEYTVEITGTGIGVSISEPITFVVLDDGSTSSLPCFIETEFSIYPNPATNYMFVTMDEWENQSKVEIWSVDNKRVLMQPMNSRSTRLNLSNLADGVYYLRLIDSNGINTRNEQIVVVR